MPATGQDEAVSSRLPSLHDRVRTFRQHGLSDRSFGHNLSDVDVESGPLDTAGAGGLASSIWLTADNHPVLHARSWIGGRLRRRRLSSLTLEQLPGSVVPLSALVDRLGHDDGPSSALLAVTDDSLFEPVQAVLDSAPTPVEAEVWLTHDDPGVLQRWRPRTGARLVNVLQTVRTAKGLEKRVAQLHELGVDAVAAFHKEWSGGSVTMAHRFGVMAFATGAEHERELTALVDAGIDGLVCAHVDRMLAVVARYYPS